MSYLLEILGRGRVSELTQLFAGYFAVSDREVADQLEAELAERPDQPDVLARLGLAYLRRYRLTDATKAFKRALALKPEYLAPRLGLACCLEHQNLDREAIEQLELANVHLPGEPAVLLALGYCHERMGQVERSAEYYRDVLERAPQTTAARERLAAIELAAGRFDQAIEQYRLLRFQTGGGDADVRLCLANLYLKAGQATDAIDEFAAAIALAPENWAARQQFAQTLADDGRLAEAVAQLKKLIAQQGDFPDLHVQLADLYARLGEDEQAVEHYHTALNLNGEYLEAAVKLATQHLRSGRFADAAVAFNRAVGINDRALSAYVGLAVAQKNAGRMPAAIDTLELAASLSPNSTLLFREACRLEMKAAMSRQGESVFSTAFAAAAPTPADETDDDWDRLIEFQLDRHRQAVADRPNHADLNYRLGLLLAGQGDLSGAAEQYRQACTVNPHYTKARIKLALVLRSAGRTDEALTELQAALDLHPQYADLHYQLGLAYRDLDRFADAADSFARSLEINGSNPEVRANLATCLESMGLMDRASAEWRRLADDEDAPDSIYTRQARLRLSRPA